MQQQVTKVCRVQRLQPLLILCVQGDRAAFRLRVPARPLEPGVDWAAAFVWGTLMYCCAIWTRSLLACVVMHGVANFLMGWYALSFGKYGLW